MAYGRGQQTLVCKLNVALKVKICGPCDTFFLKTNFFKMTKEKDFVVKTYN